MVMCNYIYFYFIIILKTLLMKNLKVKSILFSLFLCNIINRG